MSLTLDKGVFIVLLGTWVIFQGSKAKLYRLEADITVRQLGEQLLMIKQGKWTPLSLQQRSANGMRENQGVPKRTCNMLGSPFSRSELHGNLSNFCVVSLGWTINYFQKLRRQVILWAEDLTINHEGFWARCLTFRRVGEVCVEIPGWYCPHTLMKFGRRIRKTHQLFTGQFTYKWNHITFFFLCLTYFPLHNTPLGHLCCFKW